MKNIVYSYPKSSFLSMEKDLALIIDMIMKNNNLKKMLYYTSKDCLSKPALSEDESLSLFNTNIKIVPKFPIDGSVKNYIVINFDGFSPNASNPEFRDNLIEFDILCHVDQWQMQDFQLRPFRIAAEIDTMFNNKHLSGIGTLQFIGAAQLPLTSEYIGICLIYNAIHGEEDKTRALNSKNQEQIVENYNRLFND
jgi:hypothetical protein